MSKYFPFGGTTYNLGSSISSTATSILLSSFTEPVTGTPYTMALLNTDIAFGTISPKTTTSEFVSFTGITQNANGSALLTGVTRGLAKKYPFTEDTAYKLPHSGQSQFIISDAPQVFLEYIPLINDVTIPGIKTFTSSPIVPDPTTATQAANKEYVDGVAIAGAPDASTTVKGLARLSASPNGTPTALTSISNASPAVFTLTAHGLTLNDSIVLTTSGTLPTGLSLATTYYVISAGLTANAFEVSTALGGSAVNTSGAGSGTHSFTKTTPVAVGTFDTRIPTQAENDALVGNNTDIAVGTGNKFITQTGFQHNAEKYAADAGANDTYVITLSPVPTSYTNGMVVYFKANTVNTGAATINVNSLGAKTIVKYVNTTLADGDIAAGQFCTLIYDGTNFVLQNPISTLVQSNKITVNTTTITHNTNSTFTDNIVIPANTLGTSNAVRVTIPVKCSAGNGSSANVTATWGGTTVGFIFNTGSVAGTTVDGVMEIIIAASGATNTQALLGYTLMQIVVSGTTYATPVYTSVTGALDTTSNQNLVLTTIITNASLNIYGYIVEAIR